MGLPIFELPEASKIAQGDLITIELDKGTITDIDKNISYSFTPIPPFMQELLADGGLMNFAKKEAHNG